MSGSNRRGFFRLAANEAVRGAREVIPIVDPLLSLTETPRGEPDPATEAEALRTEPSSPTARSVPVEEMLEIARELGLDSRAEDLRRLATPSVRLVPAMDGTGSSFTGGDPEVPASLAVPDLEAGPARFLALLDLPEGGRVWIFRADAEADGPDEPEGPELAAVFEPADDAGPPAPIPVPPGASALAASGELTLPRPWSATVAPLGLSPAEQDSWQELRTRLAAAHGVILGESAPSQVALHRVGGYPDERRGEMPLICELALFGVDLLGRPPASHPLAAALENGSSDWRLLAQLAADDDLGWSWGTPRQRLYVWGHPEEDASEGYGSVQVVIQ